jgi:hypothetical protein
MAASLRWVAVVAVVVEIVAAASSPAFSVRADVVVAVALAAVAVRSLVRWRGSPMAVPDGRILPPKAWLALLAVVAGWELFSLAGTPRASHPTLSYLLALVTAHAWGRAPIFAAWLGLGWYLVAA